MSELNVPAELVLRDLQLTRSRDVLKGAIKELIAAGCWQLVAGERRSGLGGRKAKPVSVLVLARSDAPPGEPLAHVHYLMAKAPEREYGPASGRELSEVAKAIARDRNGAQATVLRTLADLETRGLVTHTRKRSLASPLVKAAVYSRTPEGDALLATLAPVPDPWRRRRGTDDPYYTTDPGYYAATGALAAGGAAIDMPGEQFLDSALEGFESSLDSAFDASFDAAFDASFDSAFDSGFDSGGGGDFGGGDSGGGDGGGGGGGD